MDGHNRLEQLVLEKIDTSYLVDLASQMVNIPSPTGEERPLAEFVCEQMRALGLHAHLQNMGPTRANAVGTLRGKGGGISLMFNGHLDTSYTGRETNLHGRGFKPRAVRDGEWLYGLGIYNMKGSVAAYLTAVRAIRDAGIQLQGDVVVAAVAGEIETAPVGRYQGESYEGYGSGTRYLITHGVTADMCILGEPNGLRCQSGRMGAVWFDISTQGKIAHTVWSDKAVNAVGKMFTVAEAIRRWIPDYQARFIYRNERPPVNIAAIEGGWPWRAARTAVECHLYVDVRYPPTCSPLTIRAELESLIADLAAADPDLRCTVESYLTILPAEISEAEPVFQTVLAAHTAVVGSPPAIAYRGGVVDAAHLNRYGIPTVVYGPGGTMRSGGIGWDPDEGEHQRIQDLETAAKVYGLAALRICRGPRPDPAVRATGAQQAG